jgi:predicted anti-sigma-YlaC factor YlaD
VRKSSGRAVPAEDPLGHARDERAWTDERAERYEQLRIGAEAMAGLKPQEIRCLLLKAEGLSYSEICEATGFSYTKVNRCLTEGRQSFMKRVAGIQTGAECERLAPLISKVADGEATPDEIRAVRPHLKGCLACKATLREYRAAPARLAGLVPPVVALAGGGGGAPSLLGRVLGRFGDAAGAKLAAVAASAVVLTGGGAAGVGALHHDPPTVPRSAFAQPTPASLSPAAPAAPLPTASADPDPSRAAIQAVADQPVSDHAATDPPAATTDRRDAADAAPADPQPEFDPGTPAAAPLASTRPTAAPRLSTDHGSGTRGAAEFGP